MSRTPRPELLCGRRDLDGIDGVEILDDLTWVESAPCWSISVRLNRSGPDHPFVPRSTDWFILLDEDYPWGRLKFSPAKVGGITRTFPHQDYNDHGFDDRPWRTGELCLNRPAFTMGRHGTEDEPFGVSGRQGRLNWHARRALLWLEAAASTTLMSGADPFELPIFPGAAQSNTSIAFAEDANSLDTWQGIEDHYGLVQFAPLAAEDSILLVTDFFTAANKRLLTTGWGPRLRRVPVVEKGAWIRLPGATVLEPWQGPRTWEGLCEACSLLDTNLDRLLIRVLRRLRDGGRHILLVGFPIPAEVNGPHRRMHWQPIRLPVLSQGDQCLKGFRPNRELGRYYFDRKAALANSQPLEWCASENWEPDRLGARGKMPANIADSHAVIVGCGSLGSAVAEMLKRAGVGRLTLVDHEPLEIGNLCRHTLSLGDLKGNKAESLAARLNELSPYGQVDSINTKFPPIDEAARERLQDCDLVIDCTADDRVIHDLTQFPWEGSKRFVSISLGFGARRLFCFISEGRSFPDEAFRSAVRPWLLVEREHNGGVQLPREGIGCWHPVFPARVDDVWMMAAAAIKLLESAFAKEIVKPRLIVLEQRFEDGEFVGVRRSNAEAHDAA